MKVSVIVCTRNRARRIDACLNSIAVAIDRATPAPVELIIVDNGSTDETAACVPSWAAKWRFPINLFREERPGLSVARNAGISVARGELLAFIDDDCRMSPSFLLDLLRYDAHDDGLVLRGGMVVLGDACDLPLSVKMQREPQTWSRAHPSTHRENLGDSLLGCSLTMRRELALKLGPFDEKLGAGTPIPGAEDTDYIYRAYLVGATISYVPDMAISHFHGRKTSAEGYGLLRNYALGWGALYAKYLFVHPNFCRPFLWDVKDAAHEIISRKNTFVPIVGFSHRHKVMYSLLGVTRYMRARLSHLYRFTSSSSGARLNWHR